MAAFGCVAGVEDDKNVNIILQFQLEPRSRLPENPFLLQQE
jgi:hypothetical protein